MSEQIQEQFNHELNSLGLSFVSEEKGIKKSCSKKDEMKKAEKEEMDAEKEEKASEKEEMVKVNKKDYEKMLASYKKLKAEQYEYEESYDAYSDDDDSDELSEEENYNICLDYVNAVEGLDEEDRHSLTQEELLNYLEARDTVEAFSRYTITPSGRRVAASPAEIKRRQALSRGTALAARMSRKSTAARKRKLSRRKKTSDNQRVVGGKRVFKTKGRRKKERMFSQSELPEAYEAYEADVEENVEVLDFETLRALDENMRLLISFFESDELAEDDDCSFDEAVVENFASLCDLSFQIANLIDADLRESDFEEDDVRLELGREFDRLSQDCSTILQTMEDEEVTLEDAMHDLNLVYSAFVEGIELFNLID